MDKSTPRPWKRNEHRGDLRGANGDAVRIYDMGIGFAMTPDTIAAANAALIVQAVNSFDALVEALKSADASFAQLHKINRLPAGENNAGWRDVRAALAKET